MHFEHVYLGKLWRIRQEFDSQQQVSSGIQHGLFFEIFILYSLTNVFK
jgi:hypothetical protein